MEAKKEERRERKPSFVIASSSKDKCSIETGANASFRFDLYEVQSTKKRARLNNIARARSRLLWQMRPKALSPVDRLGERGAKAGMAWLRPLSLLNSSKVSNIRNQLKFELGQTSF